MAEKHDESRSRSEQESKPLPKPESPKLPKAPDLGEWIERGRFGADGDQLEPKSNDQNLWMGPGPGDVKGRTFPRMI